MALPALATLDELAAWMQREPAELPEGGAALDGSAVPAGKRGFAAPTSSVSCRVGARGWSRAAPG